MKTLRIVKYTWLNRFSYSERQDVAQLYLTGYPILGIAKAYNSTQSTIKYHLKTLGVWVAWKKPTMKGTIERKPIEAPRTLTFKHKRNLLVELTDTEYDYDELGYRYKKTNKSYADYLREAEARKPIKRDNEKAKNKGVGDKFKCMIHVDLRDVPDPPPVQMAPIREKKQRAYILMERPRELV